MSQFMNVLLQTLLVRSHDLLQEDIVIAIYNMAAVDFSMFYKKFLPEFLKQVTTIDYHQKEVLLESFCDDSNVSVWSPIALTALFCNVSVIKQIQFIEPLWRLILEDVFQIVSSIGFKNMNSRDN